MELRAKRSKDPLAKDVRTLIREVRKQQKEIYRLLEKDIRRLTVEIEKHRMET